MRIKASVGIDEASRGRSHSRLLKDAARRSLARRARTSREARDLEILNAVADDLNREMDDVLAYQTNL
jgi:hypothetical protein